MFMFIIGYNERNVEPELVNRSVWPVIRSDLACLAEHIIMFRELVNHMCCPYGQGQRKQLARH